MRINHNLSAMTSWRMNKGNQLHTQHSLEKLSSGQRINKAGDDAAGLSISEKMRGQIRGLGQASRNIQDGISMLQTAEGGLNEIQSLLQRGRELSVQAASDTNTTQDRTNIQAEVNEILKEVDRTANNTEFNTQNLLNVTQNLPGASTVVQHLKDSWLAQSITRINAQYGINADASNLQINIVQGTPGGFTAYVSAMVNGAAGYGTNLSLNVELADYNAATNTIGGLQADRTVAHELVHAIMARTMNWSETVNGAETTGIDTWFREGTAEFIHGAEERVFGDLTALGGNTPADRAQFITDIGGAGNPWVSDSEHYSAAYTAVRYMHDTIKAAAGGAGGVKQIVADLTANPTESLDTAIKNVAAARGIAAWSTGVAGFKADFAANGGAWMTTHYTTTLLTNTDTGAIGGADVDGGSILTDITVINDTVSAADPTNFNEIWPSLTAAAATQFQIGANSGQTLAVYLSKVDSASLGIQNVDLINGASTAIDSFDNAIGTVSAERAKYGALQNRLEHSLNISNGYEENLSASESRIRDADMATEMMDFTKSNILGQASMSMLAQANQNPQGILQLLRIA